MHEVLKKYRAIENDLVTIPVDKDLCSQSCSSVENCKKISEVLRRHGLELALVRENLFASGIEPEDVIIDSDGNLLFLDCINLSQVMQAVAEVL